MNKSGNTKLQKLLNNLAILYTYDSSDIACFKFDAFMALNVRTSRQKVDRNKFVKSIPHDEWLKDIEVTIFPSKNTILADLGVREKMIEISNRVNKNREFIDVFLQESDIPRDVKYMVGKTCRYRGKLVSNFVEKMMELSFQYDVHLSEMVHIYEIVIDFLGFQWVEGDNIEEKIEKCHPIDFDRKVLTFFNDHIKAPDDKINIDYFIEQKGKNYSRSHAMSQIKRILPSLDLNEMIDRNNLRRNASYFDRYFDLYLPKNLTDEENKKIFLELYYKVYNLVCEVIWIYILSNLLDYWIMQKSGNTRALLSSWSLFDLEKRKINNLTDEELRFYINKKYFWIQIIEEAIDKFCFNRIPDTTAYQYTVIEATKYDRPESNEEEYVPDKEGIDEAFDYNGVGCVEEEDDEFMFDPKWSDAECKEYIKYIAEDLELTKERHKKYFLDRPLRQEDLAEFKEIYWSEIDQSQQFYAGEESNYERLNDNLVDKEYVNSMKIEMVKKGREHLEKYLFDKYILGGNPRDIINYFREYVVKSCLSVSNKQNNENSKNKLGFCLKTGKARAEQFNKGVNDASKVRYASEIPENIIKEMNEEQRNKMLHKIPGFYSRNELTKILSDKYGFNEVSRKTIERRLIKLEGEGKIPLSQTKEGYRGKYYSEDDLPKIIEELKKVLK